MPSLRRLTALLCLLTAAALPAATHLLGGTMTISVNNSNMLMLLDKAMAQINAESDSSNWQTVDKILTASRQVINGILYNVEVQLRETNCPKSQSLEDCTTNADTSIGQISKCTLEFVDRPWEPELEITKFCE